MTSKAIAILQSEIKTKTREVQRLVEVEIKRNIIPPLVEALEERFQTKKVVQDSVAAQQAAKKKLESAQIIFEKARNGYGDGTQVDALMRTRDSAHENYLSANSACTTAGYAAGEADEMFYKALLVYVREDLEWKRAQEVTVETLFDNISTIHSQLDLIGDAEKLSEQRKVFEMWKFRMICALFCAVTALIVHNYLDYPHNDSLRIMST
jgi:DNA gyrase/topoisomerase IV subunit B